MLFYDRPSVCHEVLTIKDVDYIFHDWFYIELILS